MSGISKLAVIDPRAIIGDNVSVGPFCVIGPEVTIGDGSVLYNNVTVDGVAKIGSNNIFYQNVVIGVSPQDLKYQGEPTETVIGDNNVFRENCTVHRGSEVGGNRTIIGNGSLFMVAVHVAHDCHIHDRVIMGNQSVLAGHVTVEDGAVISALIGIHHFSTIGKYSYLGGMTPVRRDVPPYVKFSGDPNRVRGVNEEGLKRNGFNPERIDAIKQAYRQIYRQSSNVKESVELMLSREDLTDDVKYFCEFIRQSCDSRFGRYNENGRRDREISRVGRKPFEVRHIDNIEGQEQ